MLNGMPQVRADGMPPGKRIRVRLGGHRVDNAKATFARVKAPAHSGTLGSGGGHRAQVS
jgi:hypothetical protein